MQEVVEISQTLATSAATSPNFAVCLIAFSAIVVAGMAVWAAIIVVSKSKGGGK